MLQVRKYLFWKLDFIIKRIVQRYDYNSINNRSKCNRACALR